MSKATDLEIRSDGTSITLTESGNVDDSWIEITIKTTNGRASITKTLSFTEARELFTAGNAKCLEYKGIT